MIDTVPNLKYWVAFTRILNLGPVCLRQIEAGFGDLSDAWKTGQADLANARLNRSTVTQIVSGCPEIDPILKWLYWKRPELESSA